MKCPICLDKVEVRESRKKKPFIRCDRCGLLMFVNKPFAIKKLREAASKKDSNKDDSWF